MADLEHVDLPSGAWVELRDPDDTTEAQRRPAVRCQTRIGLDSTLKAVFESVQDPKAPRASQAELTDAQIDLLSDYATTVALALIDSWSFAQPITAEGLAAIPGKKDYEALMLACGKHRTALFPSFDVDPDQDSPTNASAGTGSPAEADPQL